MSEAPNPYENTQPVQPVVGYNGQTDPSQRPQWMAIVSLICGVLSLFAWCIPLCGCPVSLAGIVFGALGIKSTSKTMAIAGMVLSALGLLGTLINAAIGAYMAATGKHPLFKP